MEYAECTNAELLAIVRDKPDATSLEVERLQDELQDVLAPDKESNEHA